MSVSIQLEAGGRTYPGVLYTGPSAAEVQHALPLELRLVREGDVYAARPRRPLALNVERGARGSMRAGEIAFRPADGALAFHVGSTPLEPGAGAPAVDPVGILEGDLSALRSLGEVVEARLARRSTSSFEGAVAPQL